MEGSVAEITLMREKIRWRRALERAVVRKNLEEKRSRRRAGSGLADGQSDEQDPGERCCGGECGWPGDPLRDMS